MKDQPTYFGGIFQGMRSILQGLRLSGKHLLKGYKRAAPLGVNEEGYFDKTEGPITIQYPKEKVPVPDNGRYRLHMETDDCIGCDKCARVCPVDCITIETFRADGDLGRTSDGTMKRLHLPTFDIDMGKCMYCGLCTTVCPTECLVMTKVYDYSEYDRDNFIYHFGAYNPTEDVSIRTETDAVLAKKKAEKAALAAAKPEVEKAAPVRRRPVVKRGPAVPDVASDAGDGDVAPKKEPSRRRPVMKPKVEEEVKDEGTDVTVEKDAAATPPKRRGRPVMKRKPPEDEGKDVGIDVSAEKDAAASPPKKRGRPVMKRKPVEDEGKDDDEGSEKNEKEGKETPETPVKKKRARPIMKRKPSEVESNDSPEPPKDKEAET